MTGILESPLGDIRLQPVSPQGWAVALGIAVALHLLFLAGWMAWNAAMPVAPAAPEDQMMEVALGPPGGRLDPAPPPPAAEPPAEPLPQATRTERAKESPPIAMTAPAPPAPANAALSSGFGAGGDGLLPAPPEPAPPPPPPAPAIDRSVLKAYVARVTQMIFDEVVYPESARRADVQGAAVLGMAIDQRGRVVQVGLLQSSGHTMLDDEIVAAVKRIRRYPPLPKGYQEPTLRFKVRVRFTMVDADDWG